MAANTPISVKRVTPQELHQFLASKSLAEALKVASELKNCDLPDAQSWLILGDIFSGASKWDDALACAECGLRLSPNHVELLLMQAQGHVLRGLRREALECITHIEALQITNPSHNDCLGTLLTYCEEPARALKFFERAVNSSPATPAYRFNLASAQRMVGDVRAAEASLDQVIAARPDDADAAYMRADLRVQTLESNHIAEMTKMLNQPLEDPQKKITLCFALAKELDDVSRYDSSFEYLSRGCGLHRKTNAYHVQDDIDTIDRIIERHRGPAINSSHGMDSAECIFIVGLPRSGTTLVERILSSHSAVYAAGELQAFPSAVIRAVQERVRSPVAKREFVDRSLEVDPVALGQSYLDATRPQTGHTPRFIDKLPLNYLYAGLIRRALPRARVIALARDPIDTCFAMYRALFHRAYPFSYDLVDLGRYYSAWHRLMRHWQVTLGDSLLIVQYEDLVAHQEKVSRDIISHCGLEWEQSCLAFNQQASAVTTASAVQVRRPIYSSSVGKWRHYEKHLRPLIQILDSERPQSGWGLAGR